MSALPALPLPVESTDIIPIYRAGLPAPAYQAEVGEIVSGGGGGGGGAQFTVVDLNSTIAAPFVLVNGNLCNLHSEIGPQVAYLPALTGSPPAAPGLYIDIMDVGNNAGVNNGTINVAGGADEIIDYATSVTTKTLTLSNGLWRFVPVLAITPFWRVFSL